MIGLYHVLATSDHPAARALRWVRRGVLFFTPPAPRLVVRPLLWGFLTVREVYYFVKRVFVCEPLFKAYCTQYGRGVWTGVYVHWIQGHGKILLGNHVVVEGKCSFGFAARYDSNPTL